MTAPRIFKLANHFVIGGGEALLQNDRPQYLQTCKPFCNGGGHYCKMAAPNIFKLANKNRNGGAFYSKMAAPNIFKLVGHFVMAEVSIAKWAPPIFSNLQTIL